ncbi:MAG: hypothetical protein OXI70_03000 [Chloroflexota bacterium]|nr:hypothetical protein [Chloroflexota bacterium]
MSAELVGILSVGATLVVGGLATAGVVVGLILKIEGRLSARMDRMGARMDRMSARMDRMEARMDRMEARQYELVQVVARMDATQQAMLATLARIEQRTRPPGDPPGQPAPFETGASGGGEPRQSVSTPA